MLYRFEKGSSAQPFGPMKNWLVAGRLPCTSCKILNLKHYINLDLNPEFSIQFRTWKGEKINHGLIFCCSHNPLCMPEDKVNVYSTWDVHITFPHFLYGSISFGK